MSKSATSIPLKIGILWFRNDLRLGDNLALQQAIDLIAKKELDKILPFYCFDKDVFEGKSRQANLSRCGLLRRNFMIECVENLKQNLKTRLNSNLLISYGRADIEIIKLIEGLADQNAQIKLNTVIASKEITSEETLIETELSKYLTQKSKKLLLVWDTTLIHLDDLPLKSLEKFPDMFTSFRKSVEVGGESNYNVRRPISLPTNYKLPTFEYEYDSSDQTMPLKVEVTKSTRSAIENMKGGEDAAINRMIEYFFKTQGLENYKLTRNGLIGTEYSSKFSLWLSYGCISARLIYAKIKEYEEKNRPNESTKHMAFELLWRDFFKFHSKKYGNGIFYRDGCHSKNTASSSYRWKTDLELFDKWCKGETGYPFVDANMKELNETGFMSNRGRQNVASFLTKDLEIDWRFGAEYFEMMLIDYDVTSNWGKNLIILKLIILHIFGVKVN